MLRRLSGVCYVLRREPNCDRISPIAVTRPARESAKRATGQKRALESAGFTVSAVSSDLPIGWTGSGTLVRQEVKEDPFGINVCTALEAVGLDATVIEYNSAAGLCVGCRSSAASARRNFLPRSPWEAAEPWG
jgi:hypothetical protein